MEYSKATGQQSYPCGSYKGKRKCDEPPFRLEDILGDEYDLDRLRGLVEADKAGRCVVLPAKPDQTIYQWRKGDDCPSVSRLDGVQISLKASDVAPVRHGRWYDKGALSCRCSECGCKSNRESNYCPNCGALMKEAEHEVG